MVSSVCSLCCCCDDNTGSTVLVPGDVQRIGWLLREDGFLPSFFFSENVLTREGRAANGPAHTRNRRNGVGVGGEGAWAWAEGTANQLPIGMAKWRKITSMA